MAEFLQSFVFLIDRHAFSKDPLLLESLRFGPEVVDKQLDDDWDAEFSKFIVLQPVDLLRYERVNGHLELIFLVSLRLSQVLALQIEAIVYQRGSSFDVFREFSTDFLRHETHKILGFNFEMRTKFTTVLQRAILLRKDLINGAKTHIVMRLDVEVRFDKYEILQILDKSEREQREYVLELEVVVRGRSLVVEVHENELFIRSE